MISVLICGCDGTAAITSLLNRERAAMAKKTELQRDGAETKFGPHKSAVEIGAAIAQRIASREGEQWVNDMRELRQCAGLGKKSHFSTSQHRPCRGMMPLHVSVLHPEGGLPKVETVYSPGATFLSLAGRVCISRQPGTKDGAPSARLGCSVKQFPLQLEMGAMPVGETAAVASICVFLRENAPKVDVFILPRPSPACGFFGKRAVTHSVYPTSREFIPVLHPLWPAVGPVHKPPVEGKVP